ncbi:MAG: hypothetical protein JO211_09000 [Acidobacteriaceae bacterium]|nr:hypothetical protein [Acidobacteriaceae bacterium]
MRAKLPANMAADPLRQGDLDGLCGIYAIINSVRLLCRRASTRFCAKLFRFLLKALERRCRRPIAIIWRGMSPRILQGLLDQCFAFVRKHLGMTLESSGLPKKMRKQKSESILWHHLSDRMRQGNIAIICLDGAYSHWTVVHAITPKTIRLLDSSGPRFLRRESCAIASSQKRFQIDPRAILVIQRKGHE